MHAKYSMFFRSLFNTAAVVTTSDGTPLISILTLLPSYVMDWNLVLDTEITFDGSPRNTKSSFTTGAKIQY